MGGLENFIMNIYRKIDREKIQFDFLVTREEKGIFDQEIESLGGKIYNIPKMEIVGYVKYCKILYNFFKKHNEYKIVHCHRDALCAVYLNQARKANIPIRIAHSHNTNIIDKDGLKGYLRITIKNFLKKFINKNATDFFACSKEAGQWLFGEYISEKELVIIKNGIDVDKYKYNEKIAFQIRRELEIDEDTFLIGHVGRFDLQKNHKFLIEIINKIDKKISNYKVCLVGDGILKDEIVNLVKQYHLEEKILFLGIRSDVNKLMMSFDLFLFPSLFEGLGIVLIEAQATGLKCIVSDTIPLEADMNIGLLKRVCINNLDEWSTEILREYYDKYNINRKLSYYEIVSNGYSNCKVKDYLTEFYKNKYIVR